MRDVFLVTDIFPPDIGGPASFIDRLARVLAERGRSVTVACASDAASEASDADRPFRVKRIPRGSPVFRHRLYSLLALEMLRHRHVLANGFEFPVFKASRLARRPYTVKIVGDYAWEFARNRSLTALSIDEFQGRPSGHAEVERMRERRGQYLRGAASVIVPSRYLRGLVVGWGVDPSKVKVILNGAPLGKYAGYAPRPRGDGPLEVAFVGRLANWKGVETLLLALRGLRNVRLSVIGDGPEWPLLCGLAVQLGLGGAVEFTGRLDSAAVRERLSRSHVLALTSSYEGLSHTLIEAAAMGLPCVASDCGGNPEVVRDGETGRLVPFGDAGAVAAALAELERDEALRLRMAARAREVSRDFDFARTVEETVALLEGA